MNARTRKPPSFLTFLPGFLSFPAFHPSGKSLSLLPPSLSWAYKWFTRRGNALHPATQTDQHSRREHDRETAIMRTQAFVLFLPLLICFCISSVFSLANQHSPQLVFPPCRGCTIEVGGICVPVFCKPPIRGDRYPSIRRG